MNILSNFIAHEKIVCADKDLPWFNKVIKSLILKKKTHSKSTAKAIITSSYYNS